MILFPFLHCFFFNTCAFVKKPFTKRQCLSFRFSCIYDTKNNFCLFERPFKIQNNGVFLFEILFFILEILTFFYYAN